MRKSQLIVLVLAGLAATASQAADGFKGLVGATLTGGGETLVSVSYTNGTTETVKSGGLVQVFGGFEYQAEGSPFVIQGNLGYHVDDTTGKDSSVRFTRFPMEVLGLWQANDQLRVGLGLRKALNTKVSSSGAASSSIGNTQFDSKVGAIVQGEWLIGPSASLFLRYVSEDYQVGRSTVSGKHVGLGATYRF
jgi:Outer membrane protein beta-barrel domain